MSQYGQTVTALQPGCGRYPDLCGDVPENLMDRAWVVLSSVGKAEMLPLDSARSASPPRRYKPKPRRTESHSPDGGGHHQRDHRRARGAALVDVHYQADLHAMPDALQQPMPALRRQDDCGPTPVQSAASYPSDNGEVFIRQAKPPNTAAPSPRNSVEWDHPKNPPAESALEKALRVTDGQPHNAMPGTIDDQLERALVTSYPKTKEKGLTCIDRSLRRP